MKLEIKLNQEQYDMLLTAIAQIAQGCVRMASAWEGTPRPSEESKPVKESAAPSRVKINGSHYWTQEEDNILIAGYQQARDRGKLANWLRKALPNRTYSACTSRFNLLKLQGKV